MTRTSDTTGKLNTNKVAMRVLIIGATGLLGNALFEEWNGERITGVGSRDVDIRDEAKLRELYARCRPEWTVLAAAYTDVDGCEKNPGRAYEVNCTGAVKVARASREVGSRLLFVSTDYVFGAAGDGPFTSARDLILGKLRLDLVPVRMKTLQLVAVRGLRVRH